MVTLSRAGVTVTASLWDAPSAAPVELSAEYGRQLGGRSLRFRITDPVWRIELHLHRLDRAEQARALSLVGGDPVRVTIEDPRRPRARFPNAPRWHNAIIAEARIVGADVRSYGDDVTVAARVIVLVEAKVSQMVAM